jgi:hypothetical protein
MKNLILVSVCGALLAVGAVSGPAAADPCPGTGTFVFMVINRADMRSSLMGSSVTPGFVAPLHTFIGAG